MFLGDWGLVGTSPATVRTRAMVSVPRIGREQAAADYRWGPEVPDVLYVLEPARCPGLNLNLTNRDRSVVAGLLHVSHLVPKHCCEVTMVEEAELAPAETDELRRLSDEYAVATSCVLKALRVVNPLERVNLFLIEEQKVAEIMVRIKAILDAEHS